MNFFALFLALFFTVTVTAGADDAALPPEVGYPELSLHLSRYDGKTIRLHGTFHYLQSLAPVFEMLMGDQPVSVFISQLPPESVQAIHALRPFSETPLTVTGVARPGPEHGNAVFFLATKIEIEGTSAHYNYDPKQGIVTCPEITYFSQRYLNSPVTMEGRFDFRSPSEPVFTMWRGIDSVEIDFSRLPDDVKTTLLQEPNFSNRLITAKGVARASPLRKGQFRLEATSVDFSAPDAAAAADAKFSSAPALTYSALLAKPDAYVNKEVQMRGSFDCLSSTPNTFQIRIGPDSIEVIDEKLSVSIQNRINALGSFSQVALRVSGKIRAYTDSRSRFYLVADKLQFVEE